MSNSWEQARWNCDDVCLGAAETKRKLDQGMYAEALHAIDLANWWAGEARRHVVEAMRDHGETWEAIGTVLDISRQAAEKRFGNKLRRTLSAAPARSHLMEDGDTAGYPHRCLVCGKQWRRYPVSMVCNG